MFSWALGPAFTSSGKNPKPSYYRCPVRKPLSRPVWGPLAPQQRLPVSPETARHRFSEPGLSLQRESHLNLDFERSNEFCFRWAGFICCMWIISVTKRACFFSGMFCVAGLATEEGGGRVAQGYLVTSSLWLTSVAVHLLPITR